MQSFNDQLDIRLVSCLIQTVLCCRLARKPNIDKQIMLAIDKLHSPGLSERTNLNFGIQTLSKLHEGSKLFVYNMIKKHFINHQYAKYSIFLRIFTLNNKRQQQNSGVLDKQKLIEKWVFRNHQDEKRPRLLTETEIIHSDLIFKVLDFIKDQNQSQNFKKGNNQEINYNTNPIKGYQLVIKIHCPKKRKNLIQVLNLEKVDSQLELDTQSLKSSLLDLPNFWEKSIQFYDKKTFFAGCYFYKPFEKQTILQFQKVYSQIIRQPDRKLSSETKAEQKDSTCSFKFSLESFSFRLSGNRKFKQSSDVQPIRKSSQQITNIHRPRYQSIYESKDEEMNIFILSPRKLSQEDSPKIQNLQQKPIKFEVTGHKGISEEVIEQFVLEPDEFMSNGSSEGFQMLEENDQLDLIGQQKSIKSLEKQQQQKKRKQKQVISLINKIENELIDCLNEVDKKWLLFL